MTDLRYPIGQFDFPGPLEPQVRQRAIEAIAQTPGWLGAAVSDLAPPQLDTPYRPGGWTVRQVVHHLPDSHLNGYTRLKLALAEDRPTIRVFDEVRWADLADARGAPEPSLRLLESLHERWVYLLQQVDEEQCARRLHHPELGEFRVDELMALYAWHGRHHVAHITTLREREGF